MRKILFCIFLYAILAAMVVTALLMPGDLQKNQPCGFSLFLQYHHCNGRHLANKSNVLYDPCPLVLLYLDQTQAVLRTA